MKFIKVADGKFSLFEFESKSGLNGSLTVWRFPCILDEENKRFFVWIGEVTMDKFTKSTFMNLVLFAEKHSAEKIMLVQVRNHPQKT